MSEEQEAAWDAYIEELADLYAPTDDPDPQEF